MEKEILELLNKINSKIDNITKKLDKIENQITKIEKNIESPFEYAYTVKKDLTPNLDELNEVTKYNYYDINLLKRKVNKTTLPNN